ncbi:MAG: UDP-N-acetylglucosamine 2-epimerase (non-hydrolyzing) [Bacteroidota bacterium]|nr:UDP-N-acetylglucosamine 2-epimerase (non-hydrolyzing) [Bacteroidota bacterium]
MEQKKIAVIFGTRPDTIKLAPVIKELKKFGQYFSVCLIATAQHREMLDDVLSVFSIQPNYDLNVMTPSQSLSALTQRMLEKLDYVLAMENPDMIVVQGDTATTFVASLAAFYRKIPVVHVEAGLRTNNKLYPFPEEIYRRLTTHVADVHCTPTPNATKALLREGILRKNIHCSGNTVIDALRSNIDSNYKFLLKQLNNIVAQQKRIVIVTTHRRENLGEPLQNICSAIKILAKKYHDVNFVFPIHLNPKVRKIVLEELDGIQNIFLLAPLNYSDFVNLIAISYAVITDSGGLQEEAPSLGKPVLVLREVTERPEAIFSGTVRLVGTSTKKIVETADKLLSNKKFYHSMSAAVNPYGDGKASERIVNVILSHFGFSKKKIKEFSPRKK